MTLLQLTTPRTKEGLPLAEFCEKCGNTLRVGAQFCGKCGTATADGADVAALQETTPAPRLPHTQDQNMIAPRKAKPILGGTAVVLLAAICVIGIVTIPPYRYYHSSVGMETRLDHAARAGDLRVIADVMNEYKERSIQPRVLDLYLAMAEALAHDHQDAADLLLSYGADESEARKELALIAKDEGTKHGNDRATYFVAHDATFTGISSHSNHEPAKVQIAFSGLGDAEVRWNGKKIPITVSADPWNSDQKVFTSTDANWGSRTFAVSSNYQRLTEVGGDRTILQCIKSD